MTFDVVDVSESFLRMPERSQITPMADWDEKSENYQGTIAMPASKKMPKKQYKSTTVKAAPRKKAGQKKHISNCCRSPLVINRYRSRLPLIRKMPPYPLNER